MTFERVNPGSYGKGSGVANTIVIPNVVRNLKINLEILYSKSPLDSSPAQDDNPLLNPERIHLMSNFHKIFFWTVLLISFILRINRLDYPLSFTFAWGDGTRDFLVASHIVKYQEFPLFGPYNLLDDSGIKNSPFYFYVLALPLLILNHPLTLGLVNIVLQTLVLVLIFLITKLNFGTQTALLALTLFSFNTDIIRQSDYIWQPYLMLPVALLALYLLIRGTLRKSYLSLILSLFTISLAFALHNSAFVWLMVFLIVSFLFLKKEKKSFKYYLGLIISVFLTLTLLYLPVILTSNGIKNLPSQSIDGYLNNLNSNLDVFLDTFNVNKLFLLALLLITTLLYKRKPYLSLMVLLFCLPILVASFFNKIRVHYLILSLPIFVILVVNCLELLKPRILKLVVIIILVSIFSGNFQFLNQMKTPLENQQFIPEVTDKIILELDQIKKMEGFTNYDFFQIKSYTKDQSEDQPFFDYPVLDTIFLAPLEQRLKTKLSKVSDDNSFNHVQTNAKKYLILACFKFQQFQISDCRRIFLQDNKNYKIIKTLHTSEYVSIYLAT